MERKKKNIVLMGFMGSGKTVIGRQAARLLNFEFADTDEQIREVTGLDLPKLFRKHGMIRFRSEERLVLSKLAQREGVVIACGGSLPPTRENLDLLRENSWFVLLTADAEVIRARLSRKSDRLLVGGRPQAEKISEQAAAWERDFADYIDLRLDSGQSGVDDTATALVAAYRQHCGD